SSPCWSRRCFRVPRSSGWRRDWESANALAQLQTERLLQPVPPILADAHGPRARAAADPAELEHALGQGGAEGPGEMMALLAPIHAVANQRPLLGGQGVKVDPERVELPYASLGDSVVAIEARRGKPVASGRRARWPGAHAHRRARAGFGPARDRRPTLRFWLCRHRLASSSSLAT